MVDCVLDCGLYDVWSCVWLVVCGIWGASLCDVVCVVVCFVVVVVCVFVRLCVLVCVCYRDCYCVL